MVGGSLFADQDCVRGQPRASRHAVQGPGRRPDTARSVEEFFSFCSAHNPSWAVVRGQLSRFGYRISPRLNRARRSKGARRACTNARREIDARENTWRDQIAVMTYPETRSAVGRRDDSERLYRRRPASRRMIGMPWPLHGRTKVVLVEVFF